MSAPGHAPDARSTWRLEIARGGMPERRQAAALAAAVSVLVEEDRPAPADRRPAAYRSRWRRAAMLELSEVPTGIKDNGAPWGGMA